MVLDLGNFNKKSAGKNRDFRNIMNRYTARAIKMMLAEIEKKNAPRSEIKKQPPEENLNLGNNENIRNLFNIRLSFPTPDANLYHKGTIWISWEKNRLIANMYTRKGNLYQEGIPIGKNEVVRRTSSEDLEISWKILDERFVYETVDRDEKYDPIYRRYPNNGGFRVLQIKLKVHFPEEDYHTVEAVAHLPIINGHYKLKHNYLYWLQDDLEVRRVYGGEYPAFHRAQSSIEGKILPLTDKSKNLIPYKRQFIPTRKIKAESIEIVHIPVNNFLLFPHMLSDIDHKSESIFAFRKFYEVFPNFTKINDELVVNQVVTKVNNRWESDKYISEHKISFHGSEKDIFKSDLFYRGEPELDLRGSTDMTREFTLGPVPPWGFILDHLSYYNLIFSQQDWRGVFNAININH